MKKKWQVLSNEASVVVWLLYEIRSNSLRLTFIIRVVVYYVVTQKKIIQNAII